MSATAAGLDALPGRARIARLVGMLGSSSEGERSNAFDAVDKALAVAGLSWGWLADLVRSGDFLGGTHERVFKRLVVDRLRAGLPAAWAMAGSDVARVRGVLVDLESGRCVDVREIDRALEIADAARRRSGK